MKLALEMVRVMFDEKKPDEIWSYDNICSLVALIVGTSIIKNMPTESDVLAGLALLPMSEPTATDATTCIAICIKNLRLTSMAKRRSMLGRSLTLSVPQSFK